jgi:hypothetical protein
VSAVAIADCPRCGAPLQAGAGWCLECGFAARTRVVRSRGWRVPLLLAAAIAAIAVVALVVAFAAITHDDNPLPVTASSAPPATTTAPSG